MNFIKKNWIGILVCFIIAVPSWLIGKRFPVVGWTDHCDISRYVDRTRMDG